MKWLLLLIVGIAIFQSKLVGGEWLTGWDNLHPEFDWRLNLVRVFSGAWQEYQGLGLAGGMAHIADLPRLLILVLFDTFLPTSWVRWVWHALMLIIGVSGLWYLGKRVFRWSNISCFVAAGYYLFNLATVQYFFLPYESFSAFYGFLPWLLAVYLSYLEQGSKQALINLFVVGLLSTGAFYVQTLFVVYAMVLAVLSLSHTRNLKRIATAWSVIFAINSFWLLPLLVSVIGGGALVGAAKINSIGSTETVLMNSAYGDIWHISTLRGYWLNYVEWQEGANWERLMEGWWRWSSATWIIITQIVLFIASLLGLSWVAVKHKSNWRWIAGLILTYIMIASYSAPFGLLYAWLVDHVPLFGEMFRSPFTKWSPVLGLFIAVGLGSLVFKLKGMLSWFLGLGFFITIVVGVWPVLSTGIFSDKVKNRISPHYFELFTFMKNEIKDGRVMYLPAQSFWSWKYHDWGYRGSGFLWYGIEQPILDRAFDVWSPYNETFYNEFSTAMYGGVEEDVATILQKYDVRYVLLDESVIAPGQGAEILRIPETKKMAEELGWKEVFHEGFLTVWDTGISAGVEFVSAPRQYVLAEGDTQKSRADVIYEDVGNYVSGVGGVKYPFASLLREEVENLKFQDDTVIIRGEGKGGILAVPGWRVGEEVELTYKVNLKNRNLSIAWEPIYTINGQVGPVMASLNQDFEGKYVWIQIGSNGVVFVEEGKEAKGTTKLAVGKPFEIKIYEGIVEREERPTGWTRDWVQKCGTNGELECYAMRLSAPTQDSLLQTISLYSGRGLEVCLDLEGEQYECVNENKLGKSPIVITQAVDKGARYWLDYVVKDKGVELQEPRVRWYPLEERLTMNESVWTKFLEEQRFEIVDKELVVEVPGIPRIYDWAELGRTTTENCDVLKRGVAEKTGNSYTANERGAVCDYLELSGIKADMPYLMRMRGENVEGRSVKLFLYNQGSGRNDIEYLLNKNTFDQTFAVLPWEWDGRYTLNTETRSFGQYAKNSLLPVEVRYFPLEQIASARMGEGEEVSNQLQINEVKKTGTWLYQVEVEGQGLLKLSQGYDEGWVAWTRGGDHRLLTHLKVSGWANGWILRPIRQAQGRQAQDKFDNDAQLVVIMYWPQLLEYLGFAMLAGAAIWIARMREKVRE